MRPIHQGGVRAQENDGRTAKESRIERDPNPVKLDFEVVDQFVTNRNIKESREPKKK